MPYRYNRSKLSQSKEWSPRPEKQFWVRVSSMPKALGWTFSTEEGARTLGHTQCTTSA